MKDLPADICLNVDGEDGLANGSLCINEELDSRVSGSKRCSIVWDLFEEQNIGPLARMKYSYLYTENICRSWTPILEVSETFSVVRFKTCYVTRRQFPLRLA